MTSRKLLLLAGLVASGLALTPARAQDTSRLFPLGGQQGTTVSLRFPGMDKEESATLLVDGEGIQAAGPFVKGAGQVQIAPNAAPGPRQIRLVGVKTATQPRPFTVGALPEVLEKEPNNAVSQAQPLTLPVTLNGAFPSGQDTDLYKLTLKKGDFLVVSTEARALAAGTFPAFHLRDSAGRALPNTLDVRKMDPVCTFLAPEDGKYLLQLHDVTGNMGSVDDGSAYRISLTTGPWIDYALPPTVQRGASHRVRFFGWNLGGKPGPGVADAEVTVPQDAGDTFLATPAGAANHARLAVTTETAADEKEPNDLPAPQVLTLPARVNGAFEKRADTDAFQFTAKAKDRLLIDVTAREWSSFADPVLTLRDSSGKTIQNVDDSDRTRDPRMVWTVPANGIYTVVLRDLAGSSRGGPSSFYQLRILPSEPQLSLTTEEPTATLKPGGKVELTVRVTQSYQPGEVTVQVEGLPKGVTVEPLKTPAMPTRDGSAQVKLVFNAAADAPLGSAPIRIVARTAGEKPLSATATWQRTGDGGTPLGSGSTPLLLVHVAAP